MQAFNNNQDRSKPSRHGKKLSIDTTFSRHRAAPPQEIYPARPARQDLTFVSIADAKARVAARVGLPARPNININRAPPNRSDLEKCGFEQTAPPSLLRSQTYDPRPRQPQAPAFHKRIQTLRPSPLDLQKDISPSDRAITIGLALSPENLPTAGSKRDGPDHATLSPPYPDQAQVYTPHHGREAATPVIVITPARDSFHLSPDFLAESKRCRPTSSVYSRYTDGFPHGVGMGNAPPMPPLPPTKHVSTSRGQIVRTPLEPYAAPFTADHASICERSEGTSSSFSRREDEDVLTPLPQDLRVVTPGLPTPHRSHGWWSVLMSPFSARSGSFFARSPSLKDDSLERQPILDDASGMGYDPHAGLIFTNRAEDDDELRSAPAASELPKFPVSTSLKRSDTAPGAVDPRSKPDFSIYYLPTDGEAASYFDRSRNFPSLVIEPEDLQRSLNDTPEGWSPSHSVYMPPRAVPIVMPEAPLALSPEQEHDEINESTPLENERELEEEDIPTAMPDAPWNVFRTPSADELKSPAMSTKPPPPARGLTQATADSMMTPLSATPVVQDAHMATFVGPHTSYGEPREVDVLPTNSASTTSPANRGLEGYLAPTERAESLQPGHARQDSHGLGISSPEPHYGPPSLPPPPAHDDMYYMAESEKAYEARGFDASGAPREPWYKRFFWIFIAIFAVLLALMVILLVMFVHQQHESTPVEASWVNTTGFPAMPVGVSTVAQPQIADAQANCVSADMWTCDTSSGPSAQPNFRFQILFRNGTLPANETAQLRRRNSRIHARSLEIAKRSAFSDYLYSPVPAPPSQDDQVFLGWTTDNVSMPYDGEETPFYISLLDPVALETSSQKTALHKRSDPAFSYPYPTSSDEGSSSSGGSSSSSSSSSNNNNNGNGNGNNTGSVNSNNSNSSVTTSSSNSSSASTSPSTSVNSGGHSGHNASIAAPTSIPALPLQQNGNVALPQLYPLVAAQPLRLYNRGLDTEHLGFYTYFDRIVLYRPSSGNGTITTGNSTSSSPNLVIYSQTRLRVQIWTRRGTVTALPASTANSTASGGPPPAKDSTANDFDGSGSFPYPVTITIDRHGGVADRKAVYAFTLDSTGTRAVSTKGHWISEQRGGAALVHPANVPGLTNGTTGMQRRDSLGYGGVDGGQGGCSCSWTTSTMQTT